MALDFPLKIVFIFPWLKKIKFGYRTCQKGRNRIHASCWKVDEDEHCLYNIDSFYLKQQKHFKKKRRKKCVLVGVFHLPRSSMRTRFIFFNLCTSYV